MASKVKRRLTTVLCADVEGYTRLMSADEAGTLATLRRYQAAMATLIERHDGRVVNTWGDAVIAEFSSVVEAVQCAVEMQQELSTHSGVVPEADRMAFRIGINLGDVMVEGDDIYGDGVNVAARLEQLAEPGGILISAAVYDQVHNKLSIGFDPLGPQHVKNLTHPVMSYRVAQGKTVTKPRKSQQKVLAGSEVSGTKIAGVWDWYLALPRPIAVIFALIGFLFLLNVFSGLDTIWFHWPAAPILFIVVLWKVIWRKRS